MRMRKPFAFPVAASRTDRSIELVCLALVTALVMLAVRIVSVFSVW
jgi:hypothetical protein